MMDRTRDAFGGRTVLVVGLGRSGLAAARHLLAAGATVRATDRRDLDALPREVMALAGAGATLLLGAHPEHAFTGADAIVLSPGVPCDLPQLEAARAHGVRILSEVDLAAGTIGDRCIAITGSNGKSTTTALVAAMMREAGHDAVACGNFGTPLVEAAADDHPGRRYAIELSSFQLESTAALRAGAAILLNVQPDHLDRHGSLEAYRAAKWRIATLRADGAPLVLVIDDPEVAPLAREAAPPVLAVSSRAAVTAGGFVDGERLVLRTAGREEILASAAELPLPGRHNRINALAAAAACRGTGIPLDAVRRGALGMRPLPHRLDEVARVAGVRFVDDSKATNVASALEALRAMTEPAGSGPVVLLLGGRDKASDFAPLAEAVAETGARVMTFGEAGPRIAAVLREAGAGERIAAEAPDLESAVRAAFRAAAPGGTVLLSPACASFDAFGSFAERGDAFAATARALAAEEDE